MGDVVSNIMKGRLAYYGTLPAANDSLIAILLKSSGLEADGTLVDYDDLAALLAAANDEADATNYARKTLASVTVTVDDTNNRVDIDCDDLVYTTLGGASNNTIGKLAVCYKPDTSSVDSAIVPLSFHDVTLTTDGTTVNVTVPSGGFTRAA